MLLPDAVAFMYALSIGGMNELDILEATARADDVYGEISKEFEDENTCIEMLDKKLEK